MKMIKNATTALVSIAAVVAMTACSSDSDSSGGGGSSALATGGFIKSVGNVIGSSMTDVNPAITDIRMQHLYTASDIDGSGYINEIDITYEQALAADITCTDVLIKMGHTDVTDLTTALDTNIEQGKGMFETVATIATHTFPAGNADDKYTYTLDTPFLYNGVDSLVVEFDRGAACDGVLNTKTTSTPTASVAYVYNSNSASSVNVLHINMDFTFAGGDNTIDYAGTSGNTWPFSTSLPRVQMLYNASDVNGSGPLTGVAFQVGAATAGATYSATVKMGHTALSAFTNAALFEDSYSAAPTVMENNVTFTVPAGLALGDWFWVPLNGSFNYNGTDNLIVDINVTAATASTSLTRGNLGVALRLSAVDGAVTGADTTAYDTKLRFNGAPMSVVETNLAAYGVAFGGGSGEQFIYGGHVLGTAAQLSSISFRVAQDIAADATYTDVNITIGHTTLSNLTATLADNMDDATVVSNGDITIPAGTKAGDWITIPVSGFTYDPTKNLTIQIDPMTTSFSTNIYYGGNGVVSNSGAFTAGSPTFNGTEGSRHPHLQLGFTK